MRQISFTLRLTLVLVWQ